MLKLVNLLKNENLKITRKTSTWVMVGILVLLVVTIGLIVRFEGANANANNPNKDWKKTLASRNQTMKKDMAKKNISESDMNYYEKQYAINSYRIEHDIQPVDSKSLWGFVEDSASLIALISLFAIVFGGGIVANEFSDGTIKLLLIRPSKRWKILLSKYISVMTSTLVMLLILFVTSFLVGGILFSFGGVSQPYLNYHNGAITEVNMVAHILSVYGLDCINLIMMVTLAFMISTIFRSSSLAIGVGVFLMYAGNIATMLLSRYNWSKYILFANVDLTQYITGTPMIKGMTMTFSIVVLIVYFIIFNVVSFVGFNKRDVAA